MSIESWLIFMAIWVAASIPLGPNAVNCISASATHGFMKGLWSVVGLFLAGMLHMTLALSGMSAFLAANPALFDLLRWAGVVYLAWLGISMLRPGRTFHIQKGSPDRSAWQLVRNSILISLSNPKAIFVWLAVFTQFVDATIPLMPQLLVLAPSALFVTIIVYGGYCAVGLGVNRIFSGSRKLWFDRFTGSTYLVFALGLATSDLRRV